MRCVESSANMFKTAFIKTRPVYEKKYKLVMQNGFGLKLKSLPHGYRGDENIKVHKFLSCKAEEAAEVYLDMTQNGLVLRPV